MAKKITIQHLYATGATKPIPASALTWGEIAINANCDNEAIYIKNIKQELSKEPIYDVKNPFFTKSEKGMLQFESIDDSGLPIYKTLKPEEIENAIRKWKIFRHAEDVDETIDTLKEIKQEINKFSENSGGDDVYRKVETISGIVGDVSALTDDNLTQHIKRKENKSVISIISGETNYIKRVYKIIRNNENSMINSDKNQYTGQDYNQHAVAAYHYHPNRGYLDKDYLNAGALNLTINCGSWDELV